MGNFSFSFFPLLFPFHLLFKVKPKSGKTKRSGSMAIPGLKYCGQACFLTSRSVYMSIIYTCMYLHPVHTVIPCPTRPASKACELWDTATSFAVCFFRPTGVAAHVPRNPYWRHVNHTSFPTTGRSPVKRAVSRPSHTLTILNVIDESRGRKELGKKEKEKKTWKKITKTACAEFQELGHLH